MSLALRTMCHVGFIMVSLDDDGGGGCPVVKSEHTPVAAHTLVKIKVLLLLLLP